METGVRKYEISFLSTTENGAEEISRLLSDSGAEISETAPTNRIKLAFPIKKETFAFFGYFLFLADPAEVKKIKEAIKFVPGILRSMVIVNPALPTKPDLAEKELAAEEARSEPIAPESVSAPKKSWPSPDLSNEELEKKLEEILS